MKLTPRQLTLGVSLVAIAVLGLGSIFYTAIRLRNNPEYLSDYTPDVKKIEKAQGETITLTETRNGNRKWVLKMKGIRYNKDNSIADLQGVQGLVYGDAEPAANSTPGMTSSADQKVMFTFEAPHGTYYKSQSRIFLDQGTKLISPSSKIILTATNVEFSSGSNLLSATGGVQMDKQDFGITKAQSAEVTMDFSKIRLQGGTDTVISE